MLYGVTLAHGDMAGQPGESSSVEGSTVREELNPEIGLIGALAIGVGTMIAAGIFVLSGLAVAKVGAVAIGSFLIAAVIAGFTAAAYAEFSSIYQESGGGYMYVANTFDSDLTYIMGWTMILGYPASAAFYLASFSDWFFRFIYPPFSIPDALPFWIPGLTVLGLLLFINLKGTEESSQFQIVVTALKVALLLLFLWGGLQALDPAVVQQSVIENIDKFAQIGLTSALVFITFFGFSAIATNAEEIRDPGRTIPRAIYLSMGIVTIIYALVVLVIVIAVNSEGFRQFLTANVDLGGLTAVEFIANNGEVSMGYAARYYLDIAGDLGFYVIIVGALFSMLSAANATIMAGSRVNSRWPAGTTSRGASRRSTRPGARRTGRSSSPAGSSSSTSSCSRSSSGRRPAPPRPNRRSASTWVSRGWPSSPTSCSSPG